MDDRIDVLFDQLAELSVAIDRLLKRRDLVPGHIARHVFTLLPALMVVEGTVGSFADDRQFAALQVSKLSRLLEKSLRV